METDVAAMETATMGEEIDRIAVGRHLEAVTTTLQRAGALATASAGLTEPLTRLARWLGPLGASVLSRS